jgi:site-specific DNA recombinase
MITGRLEAKLQDISEQKIMRVDINNLIDRVIESFSKLDILYDNADIKKQRHIVSSLFPEKLDFDGVEHRTLKYNVIGEAIYLINSLLREKKDGKTLDFEVLSRGVVPTRIELISRV